MSGKHHQQSKPAPQQPVDPVEAMKVLRTTPRDVPLDTKSDVIVEDDLTPGVLPVVAPPVAQVFLIVEEDRQVLVKGQQCLWRKGRRIDASSYGAIVIDSLLAQGLKVRTETVES